VEQQDGATGNTYKFSVATGNVEDNATYNVGNVAGSTWQAQGFKVSETTTLSAIWVKLLKVQGAVAGNAGTLQLYVLPDAGAGTLPTGSTPITNGTATPIAQKVFTTKTDGEWYRFVFPTPPTLTGGTTYHLAMKSSIAVDATNYIQFKSTTPKKYPLGQLSTGDGTPTWSPGATITMCFLAETAATAQVIQPAGVFDQKFSFKEGTPLNQSRSFTQPLRNFFDGKEFTYYGTWTALTKDKTFADFLYGLDHDRIVLRCNVTTGFPQLDVYDNLGAKRTVLGTIDVSSGNHQVGVHVRARGDGADKIELLIDGAVNATLGALTLNFDPLLRDLGTAWVGGGFVVTPVLSTNSISPFVTTTLGGGWSTWSGTSTVANAASVVGGKLVLNKAGYAATDTGFYTLPTAALSNANGWAFIWKCRVGNNVNIPLTTTTVDAVAIAVLDGTKRVDVSIQEYFIQTSGVSVTTQDFIVQGDFKSQEHVYLLQGKGSDYFLWIDGKLAIDGTGKLLGTASAVNEIRFGDTSAVSGTNADSVWSYFKYYTTAALLPQATSGSLSEFATWSGDKTNYAVDLYAGGTFNSVKKYCGMERNYVENIVQREIKKGVISAPTASGTMTLTPDLELYCIGSNIYIVSQLTAANASASSGPEVNSVVDNVTDLSCYSISDQNSTLRGCPVSTYNFVRNLGLHKAETKWRTSSGTLNGILTQRCLTVESKS